MMCVDFNADQCVTILDFSLLSSNFALAGDALVPQVQRVAAIAASGGVLMATVPQTSTVTLGNTFGVEIRVQSGAQEIDGAAG